MSTNKSGLQPQPYKYIAILDFEATCDDKKGFGPFEIIELPTLLLNTCTLKIDAEFHEYVQPTKNPIQSNPDNNLDNYEDADPMPNVNSVCFLTFGDWDLKTMLPLQFNNVGWSRDSIPAIVRQWINAKTAYKEFYNKEAQGMPEMLADLKLTLDGHHHCGIDDCRNISKIVVKMIQDGAILNPTAELK